VPAVPTLVLFSAAAVALLLVPGPSVLYIVTRSIDQGRRAGIVSVLGIETGALVHVAGATLGLSALLASSVAAFETVRWLGVAYLAWLGLRKLFGANGGESGDEDEVPGRSLRRLFGQGVLVNVLNPKTALFFLAFLPQFIHPDVGPPALQAAMLGMTWIVLALICDGAYALAAGTLSTRLRGVTGGRGMRIFSGGVYLGLGAVAALSGGRPESH
jgi:threonine/homoserine/homoserine lactone efflux protein